MCGNTEPVVAKPVVTSSDILEAAAKVLEGKNWIKQTYYHYSGGGVDDIDGCCAMGAVRLAKKGLGVAGPVPNSKTESGYLCHSGSTEDQKALCEATSKLADQLGVDSIPTWNDTIAKSKDEVITAMRKAAGTYVEPVIKAETILDKAAELLEANEWTQGRFVDDYNEPHAACAVGAMRWAYKELKGLKHFNDTYQLTCSRQDAIDTCGMKALKADAQRQELCAASIKLADAIGVDHIPTWNDAPERTKADVVKALRVAAGMYVEPEPVVAVEPAPVVTPVTPVTEEAPVSNKNPNIRLRKDLKPGTVFYYFELPVRYAGSKVITHKVDTLRFVSGAKPGYLFRDTAAHKARFAAAVASPGEGFLLDSDCDDMPVLVIEE